MSIEEFQRWLKDATACLAVKYTQDEINKIIEWFTYMKGSDERDLVGDNRVDAMLEFHYGQNYKGNLYDSLMSRLWIYAPHILSENS